MPDAQKTLTMDEINAVMLQESKKRGYCLCIHPFMGMIDFSGTRCAWCRQPVTKDAWGPEAKAIRTEALIAAYPETGRP